MTHIRPMGERTDLNAFQAGGQLLLLTVAGGSAVHLTPEARDDEDAYPAASDRYYLDDLEQGYDRTALTEPRWSGTSLCGREWILMVSEDPGSDFGPISSPSCRSCLAVMDRFFPAPLPDARLARAVSEIVDTVLVHGCAEIRHVPGDQQAALRSQVRKALKRRTGFPVRTFVIESLVVVVCQPISDLRFAEHAQQIAEAMGSVLAGKPARLATPWRLSWDSWAG